MDRPYDDSETLGMTDVDDGTPIPRGTGAYATNGSGRHLSAHAHDDDMDMVGEDDTYASGDQAAASSGHLSWLDQLTVSTRQEPLAHLAIAAGAGLVLGLLLGRR